MVKKTIQLLKNLSLIILDTEAMETEPISKQNGVNGEVSASWFEQPAGKKEQQVEDSDEEVVVLGD